MSKVIDNSRKGKKNKIRPGYGVFDYYKYYLEQYKGLDKYKVTRKVFGEILKEFHKELAKEIVFKNYEFDMPMRLGKLCLRKFKPTKKIEADKLINHSPPDWKKTKELWKKDPEALDKRILVRHINKHTNGFIFEVVYKIGKANYRNKSAYTFSTIRDVKKLVNVATREYNIDALLRR